MPVVRCVRCNACSMPKYASYRRPPDERPPLLLWPPPPLLEPPLWPPLNEPLLREDPPLNEPLLRDVPPLNEPLLRDDPLLNVPLLWLWLLDDGRLMVGRLLLVEGRSLLDGRLPMPRSLPDGRLPMPRLLSWLSRCPKSRLPCTVERVELVRPPPEWPRSLPLWRWLPR